MVQSVSWSGEAADTPGQCVNTFRAIKPVGCDSGTLHTTRHCRQQGVLERLHNVFRLRRHFEPVCRVAGSSSCPLHTEWQGSSRKARYWRCRVITIVSATAHKLNSLPSRTQRMFSSCLPARSKFLCVKPWARHLHKLSQILCVLTGHRITEQIKYNLLISLKWRNLVEVPHR